jgi:S-adenosylmethionine synthetase
VLFSGKDPTKVDRSASYFARYIAKNIVANGLAEQCKVEMVFAIGMEYPIVVNISNFEDEKIVKNLYKISVNDIIEMLDLRKPKYRKCSMEGHFGINSDEYTWEEVGDTFKKLMGDIL